MSDPSPEPEPDGAAAARRRSDPTAARPAASRPRARPTAGSTGAGTEAMPVDLAVQYYERDRDSFASVLGAAIALRLFLFFVPGRAR